MDTGVIIVLTICASVIIITGMGLLYCYRLNKQHIQADAMVKAEEIKAKNQLEIEKLIVKSSNQNADEGFLYNEDATRHADKDKLR